MTININPIHSFNYGGTRVNVFHANKGEGLTKHTHELFAHATMCNAGSCWIRKSGKEVLIDKNTQPINLVANEWHEIEAAEDGTVFVNIFAEVK
jgi:quercetin dioxygenase-like cupin family protein